MSREAYITGIGQSQVGVRVSRSPLLLTLDAFKEALHEAGLTTGQIDGVATYPGKASSPPGYSPIGVADVVQGFGLKPTWYMGASEITSQFGAIVAAADAVKAGHARHVMCFRTVYEASARAQLRTQRHPESIYPLDGFLQWFAPFGAMSAASWVAQYAMRHVKAFGLTREQLGQIAITGHANATLNPNALVREPLSLDRYMSARMISSPLCLFDCDRFTDASTVLIVSAGDALDEVACTPIRIAASGVAVERHSWDQDEWFASYSAGPELWRRADYGPDDVHVAQLYDGFSFLCLAWLEALGFCPRGEGGRFIEGGQRIARDGDFPLNTAGGQLGAGRLHGFGFAHEAVVQLRGLGGCRQVGGDPRVAVATAGGGPDSTALLLARD